MTWLYFADKIDTAVKGKKKVKKAIVGVLAILSLTFVLALAGCSNNQEQSEDENGVIVALVTATDTENITIEITDAGNTNLEVGKAYTISVSDNLPTLGEGDYIRVVCNPSAISQADIPHIEEVVSVDPN